MKSAIKYSASAIIFCFFALVISSFYNGPLSTTKISLPYKQAGLTERQAAAHLLSRFTYGATPGQIDEVVKIGLEKWLEQQINGGLSDDSLNKMLNNYDVINLTNEQVVKTFPRPAQILRLGIKDGAINKDSVNKGDKKEYRQQLQAYMQKKGLRPQQELLRQFINQKILRATYTNNQLQEILTDFWFNHFNVSLTKNDAAQFIPAYERDVIRPNVLGNFETILMATAKSPAMLMYLDNFSSAGVSDNDNMGSNKKIRQKMQQNMEQKMGDSNVVKKLKQAKKAQGLNENYAREVMELHTLGVDGGYTQQDVTQAARVLTGWTVYPLSDYGYGSAMKNIVNRIGEDKLEQRGFVHEGDFLFAMNRHDTKEKTVLGKTFAANGGYEEGVQLLKMLAHHPSTAKFIAKKLAVRFVNDAPSQTLVDKMAKTFTEKNGDIKEVLITMVSSSEFWNKDALREKTKSPFELAISAVRTLHAQIDQPYQLFNWITRMGQKMYFYQAPTGFPDNGQYWINTGALLNRMNFGLALASQRIPGIKVNLLALNSRHEPESASSALSIYSKLVMPERNLDETIKRLTPLLNDPNLVKKVDDAAGKTAPLIAVKLPGGDDEMMDDTKQKNTKEKISKKNNIKKGDLNYASMQTATGSNTMLSQVVGIIIGSPEFQRK